jgi:hypothetical protein
MMAVAVLLAAALCGHLAMRLHAAKTEIADLRTNIAHLKRRLNQRS